MASLELTLDEVKKDLGLLLNIGRDPASDWDADTIADVNRVIRSGRRKFFSAHPWRHLEEIYTFITPAVYETGTITVVDGVVSGAGTTFPDDSADYVLLPDEGGAYEVNTRDSGTQLTLHDTSLDIDAGEEYELRRVHFELPTGFVAFLDPLTIENTPDGELREMPVLPEWTIRGIGSRETPRIDRPELFSLFQTVDDETGVFTPYLSVYPIPDAQYTVSARIRVEPGDALLSAGAIAHAGFSELMREAILAAGEEMFLGGVQSLHIQNFDRMLPQFIRRDGLIRGARRLRPRRTDRQLSYRQYKALRDSDSTSSFPFNE